MRLKIFAPVAGLAAALAILAMALGPGATYAMGCNTVPGVRGPDECLPQIPTSPPPQPAYPYPTMPSANQSSGACASDGVHVVDCGGGLLIPPGQCVTIDSRVPGTSIGGVSQAGSGCASGSQGGSGPAAAAGPPAPAQPAKPFVPQYNSRNGLETIASMTDQLHKIGYAGPSDDSAIVAAYAQATGAPVTPAGTFTNL